jgi:phosphatidylglycerophosphatase A
MRRAVLWLTSWFGLGYMPFAPGTWGTLGALPLWWLWRDWPWQWQLCFAGSLTLVAIWLADIADGVHAQHDSGHIVIDEVCGLLFTVVAVPFRTELVVGAFLLFRALDIWKPGPVRRIDRSLGGGAGVVLDDVLAGVLGCALLHAGRLLWGWW